MIIITILFIGVLKTDIDDIPMYSPVCTEYSTELPPIIWDCSKKVHKGD